MIVFDKVSATVRDGTRDARASGAAPVQPKAAAAAAPNLETEARLRADLATLERRKLRVRAT